MVNRVKQALGFSEGIVLRGAGKFEIEHPGNYAVIKAGCQ
jgi:hypothetical protein